MKAKLGLILLLILCCCNSDKENANSVEQNSYSNQNVQTLQVEKVMEISGAELPEEQAFYRIGDIEVDNFGNIYIADFSTRRIKKFSPAGHFLVSFGRPGQGPGEFGGTFSLELDSMGYVYVADGVNGRIQKFSSNGKFLKSFNTLVNDYNDFEIVADKIFYRVSTPKLEYLLNESDTSFRYSKPILPIKLDIEEEFKNVGFAMYSYAVTPDMDFVIFNSITKKFYLLDYKGNLLHSCSIRYKKLLNLIEQNKEKVKNIRRLRKISRQLAIDGEVDNVPIFPILNTFDNHIFTMFTINIEFGNSLDYRDILFEIDNNGNILKEYTGFKKSNKIFTIDKQGYIYAVEWDEAKVCKYQIINQ